MTPDAPTLERLLTDPAARAARIERCVELGARHDDEAEEQ